MLADTQLKMHFNRKTGMKSLNKKLKPEQEVVLAAILDQRRTK